MPKQTDIVDRLAAGSRVAVIRLRSLGDCVLTTPAIHLLKKYRPDLELAVVAEDRFSGVFEGNPDVSCVLPPTVGALRSFAPVLCLNLHGGTRASRLTLLSSARFRTGFDIFRPGWIYNTPIPTAQEVLGLARRVHTAEHIASAMFYLGVPVEEVPRARIPALVGRSPHAPASPYVVIHPLAALPEKTWPCFTQLEFPGLERVVVAGPAEKVFGGERMVIGASLPELAQLMRDADLFVGNDSGPAHIAAAFGVPSLVFFGPSDSEIWSPWRTPHEVLQGTPIASITVEQAQQAITGLRALRGTQ